MSAVAQLPTDQDISVQYDQTSGGVTVNPGDVDKGTTVRFKDPQGGKVRIVFLSPTGNETDTVLDSQPYPMTIGGIYHFVCFFTPKGSNAEVAAKTGGTVGVNPPRP